MHNPNAQSSFVSNVKRFVLRPVHHRFSKLLQVQKLQAASERSLRYFSLKLLFCYAVSMPFVLLGVSRDLGKIAARNYMATSSWSQRPRLTLVLGHW